MDDVSSMQTCSDSLDRGEGTVFTHTCGAYIQSISGAVRGACVRARDTGLTN